MPSLTAALLFALATLLLTASPGPGVLYVSARALSQGRRAGFASMFGIEFGELVWLAAVATGLAALLETSVAALTFLRFAGAAYLIYLGIQRWRHHEAFPNPRLAPLGTVFAQGVVTQILNPKVAVFFVAFLPQFLNPAQPLAAQCAILGAIYIGVALLVDTAYVMSASALSQRFMRNVLAQKAASRIAAGTYFVLGLAAAVTGDRPTR